MQSNEKMNHQISQADIILSVRGDMRPLELLAARYGFLLLPMKAIPDGESFEAEALQDFQALAKYQAEENPIERVHRHNDLIRELLETHAIREQLSGVSGR